MRRGFALGIVALVAGAVGVFGFRTYDYVEHDPHFCQTCHLMNGAFSRWEQSVHHEVGCHSCHVQSIEESVDQLYRYITLRPTQVGRHAEVDFTRCGACHLSRDPRWKQVADTAGHQVHFAKLGLQCVACHSRGVHEFVRPTEACRTCHADQMTSDEPMASLHCTACHPFLATDHALADPGRADCLACHGDMQVADERFAADAPMRFPCQQCHHPHQGGAPARADCLHCHHVEDFGLHRVAAHTDCRSCHVPHLWRVAARAACERCHDDRRQHEPDRPCAACHDFHHAPPAGPGAAPREEVPS